MNAIFSYIANSYMYTELRLYSDDTKSSYRRYIHSENSLNRTPLRPMCLLLIGVRIKNVRYMRLCLANRYFWAKAHIYFRQVFNVKYVLFRQVSCVCLKFFLLLITSRTDHKSSIVSSELLLLWTDITKINIHLHRTRMPAFSFFRYSLHTFYSYPAAL